MTEKKRLKCEEIRGDECRMNDGEMESEVIKKEGMRVMRDVV